MSLTLKMVLMLGLWYVVLMDRIAIIATEECPENEYQLHTKEGPICCQKCLQYNPKQPCDTQRVECRCAQGHRCLTESCAQCTRVPNCAKGQQLNITVQKNSMYNYICEKCPEGTFSEVQNGICKPGEAPIIPTKNSRDGLHTSIPGTQTDGKNLPPTIYNTESIFANYPLIVIYSALAVIILFLITIFIHLLIWKMKAKPTKMPGLPFPPQMIVAMNIKEDADSWSYKYPEEEHGDDTTEKCAC